jgi:GTP cyclohydrolase FolE2
MSRYIDGRYRRKASQKGNHMSKAIESINPIIKEHCEVDAE